MFFCLFFDSIRKISWMVNNISLYYIFVLNEGLRWKQMSRKDLLVIFLFLELFAGFDKLISGELSVLGHGVCSSGVQGSMSYCPTHQSTEFCLKSS